MLLSCLQCSFSAPYDRHNIENNMEHFTSKAHCSFAQYARYDQSSWRGPLNFSGQVSAEKNLETYKDQHRNRGKIENTEKDIPVLRRFLDEGKKRTARTSIKKTTCKDDFSAAKRRDAINILLLSPYGKVRIVVFPFGLWPALFMFGPKIKGENSLCNLQRVVHEGSLARFTNLKNRGQKKFVFPSHENKKVRCSF